MSISRKVVQSFENSKPGYSGRKLTAFWAVVFVATPVTFRYTDVTVVFEVLCAWLVFASLCLGLVTAQNIIELKSGPKQEDKKSPDEGDLPL